MTTNHSGNLSDFDISVNEIAVFDFNGQRKRIWASKKNADDKPQIWQFRYEPLFIPEIKDNQILASSERWSETTWRTNLTILLDNDQSQVLAYRKICTIFPEQASKIQPSSILALPVHYVEIDFPDLEELIPSAKLITTSFENIQSEFTIKIASLNEETALKIQDSLSKISLKYKFSISASKAKQNRVDFSLNQFKGSKFYTDLKGLGNTVYVHRDDLRKLTEVIRTQIQFKAVIEKPDVFDNSLLEKLLERWKQTESSKLFDDTKWQSTYNQDDLKPDVITKEINKLVTKDDQHDLWKINEASLDVLVYFSSVL